MADAGEILREYVNGRLSEDRAFFEEDKELFEIDGETVTLSDIDQALTDVLE